MPLGPMAHSCNDHEGTLRRRGVFSKACGKDVHRRMRTGDVTGDLHFVLVVEERRVDRDWRGRCGGLEADG